MRRLRHEVAKLRRENIDVGRRTKERRPKRLALRQSPPLPLEAPLPPIDVGAIHEPRLVLSLFSELGTAIGELWESRWRPDCCAGCNSGGSHLCRSRGRTASPLLRAVVDHQR